MKILSHLVLRRIETASANCLRKICGGHPLVILARIGISASNEVD